MAFNIGTTRQKMNDLMGQQNLIGAFAGQQGPRMTHLQIAGEQHRLDRVGEIQQPQDIGGRAA